jgi:hypothetical protein
MDKEGTGKGIEEAKATIKQIRSLGNAVVAVGQNIALNEFDRGLKEISGVLARENVRWFIPNSCLSTRFPAIPS